MVFRCSNRRELQAWIGQYPGFFVPLIFPRKVVDEWLRFFPIIVSKPMTLTEFNNLYATRLKETKPKDWAALPLEMRVHFLANETALRNEFFESNESGLKQKNPCVESLLLLSTGPFREADYERLQRLVLTAIDTLEKDYEQVNIPELVNFIWVILDEMLHSGTIHDKDALTSRLRNLKTSLAGLEVKFPGEFDLLDQKIGHFFDVPSPGSDQET